MTSQDSQKTMRYIRIKRFIRELYKPTELLAFLGILTGIGMFIIPWRPSAYIAFQSVGLAIAIVCSGLMPVIMYARLQTIADREIKKGRSEAWVSMRIMLDEEIGNVKVQLAQMSKDLATLKKKLEPPPAL